MGNAVVAVAVTRPEYLCRVRFFPAILAGLVGGIALLILYYLTLGLLPIASDWPTTGQPVAAWAHRFDIAQFVGTIFIPPTPTLLTWWVGLAVWLAVLAGCGAAFAISLSWSLQRATPAKGVGFALALCIVFLFGLSLAQGYHPAIMRNSLPDTGMFMLGWSLWGAIQILVLSAVYGAILGGLYDHWSLSNRS